MKRNEAKSGVSRIDLTLLTPYSKSTTKFKEQFDAIVRFRMCGEGPFHHGRFE
jgi:hypothetical protein